MKNAILMKMTSALVGGACLLAATPAMGMEVYLRADAFDKALTDGTSVYMWGFALTDPTFASGDATVPGPALVVPAADPQDTTLTIHLKNNLPEDVSIVIPGQNSIVLGDPVRLGSDMRRAASFTKVATAGGGVQTYIWSAVAPGTYIYHSGRHPALQVQMGLYGMLKKDTAPSQAYNESYNSEDVWFFSDIDLDVHEAVMNGTYGVTVKSMIKSVPEIFLLNGDQYRVGSATLTPGETKLVRMLNTCYDERIPVLLGSYAKLIAEDGRKYPYAKLENAIRLPAMKTLDALLTTSVAGGEEIVKFFDRRYLSRAAVAGP
ncbi:MAG: multicopper oxidase domain-containing protein [Verrucomicrobiia bacterium]